MSWAAFYVSLFERVQLNKLKVVQRIMAGVKMDKASRGYERWWRKYGVWIVTVLAAVFRGCDFL